MSYRANGKLHAVFETEQKTERFRKRDFVLEISDGNFEQHVKFQLTGDRCEALDEFSTGDDVEVEFSLRGREWKSPQGDIRYFSNLDVWTVHRAAEGARGAPPSDEPPPPEEPPHFGEDPPF